MKETTFDDYYICYIPSKVIDGFAFDYYIFKAGNLVYHSWIVKLPF